VSACASRTPYAWDVRLLLLAAQALAVFV
jgi:hypothetical protein